MKFQCVDDIRHPIDKVFSLVRDDMPAIVPYLNDVEGIEVLERTDQPDGTVKIVNLWRGSARKAPSVVRKFLSPQLLSWKDHAVWHDSGPRRAEWRLEPHVGGSLFECTGTTSVLEGADGHCKLQIEGDLRIYPERLPGVPRILAGRMRSKIEGFVIDMILPNMQTMARGVQAYFDDKDSGRLEQY